MGAEYNERLLRALFVPGQGHAEDLMFTNPHVYELVGINGVEVIRRYYITSTRTDIPFDRLGDFRKRTDTLRRWERLTGERLTPALEPVASESEKSGT